MRITLALLLVCLSACSHVRLKYEAQVSARHPDTKEQKTSDYVYYKSYEVGALNQFACGLTAVLWGGWCWSYLGYPTESMVDDLKFSAEEDLHQKLGKSYFIDAMKVERHGYDQDQDLSYFISDGQAYKKMPFLTNSNPSH